MDDDGERTVLESGENAVLELDASIQNLFTTPSSMTSEPVEW